MSGLRFLYRTPGGEVTQRHLERWAEVGHYVEGFDVSAQQFRTFRKDRVLEYLDGAQARLREPHSSPPPRARTGAPPDARPQILFTGFAAVQRAHLESLADAGGLKVVKTVTQGLSFLCSGPNAGPAKVAKSRTQGVYIVREPELHALLATGELPDYAIDDLL